MSTRIYWRLNKAREFIFSLKVLVNVIRYIQIILLYDCVILDPEHPMVSTDNVTLTTEFDPNYVVPCKPTSQRVSVHLMDLVSKTLRKNKSKNFEKLS